MRALNRIVRFHRESPADDVRQRLRDLPCDEHPPYDFTEFQRRARERSKGSAIKWQHAAAAAGVTVLVASMAMWGRSDHHAAGIDHSGVAMIGSNNVHPVSPPVSEEPDSKVNAIQAARAAAASRAAQEAVANQFAVLARTQGSQRWLEEQPAEPAVVSVGPRLVVATLEDRIAWVDDALSDAQFGNTDAARTRTLERERAQLIKSLAQVRYAETLAAQIN